jgi:subtilisin-like proprotein convertase family protein
MRRIQAAAFAASIALSAPLFGLSAVSAADVPKATPRLLRELARQPEAGGADAAVDVIVGLADGTPSAHELAALSKSVDQAARARRIEAQQTFADETAAVFQPKHFYESFSMISGRVTRAGLARLSKRADVAWITLDGVKRFAQVSTQPAQTLIRSDAANSAGFTGAGSAIAIVDTGVDYTIADMGGGAFPNAKVIGGTDIADLDQDPTDCEGHGTEVANVAAGPNGVAPGARIVAVKVFKSSGGCDTAFDSDILGGVNYAVTNQAHFGIVAINLSLGGEYEDTADHGFCDLDAPDYKAAFDAANAAGILVSVASGNGSRANQISQPACVSSAIAVGAVYSSAFSRVTWSDPDGCTDSPVSPDQVVCFSDSNTNVALLAPGAFWSVHSKGNSLDTQFAGTSASSPAVAGAICVVHQAKPSLTPAAIVALLRGTGKALTDAKSGVISPRIDVLAAVQAASTRLAAYSGPPISIPDGTGSATATVTTSGFTGTLGTVQAWVEINHPQPAQLRVTLTGPDGLSLLLANQTGTAEHPINAFYGKTDAAAQSLDGFAGHPANGVWTLKVEDLVAGTTGTIRNFAIQLVQALAPCVANSTTLCLNNGRFQTTVAWQVPTQGTSGVGMAVPLTTDTGYMWFFTANNIELMIKVVDGRTFNGKFWVFYGALTDVQYTVTVTDTVTGNVKTYFSPQGTPQSRADTAAFD